MRQALAGMLGTKQYYYYDVGRWLTEIALELAEHDPTYQELAVKFFEHFLWIAASMDRVGDNEDELWDEEDGFFYDLLRLPDGRCQRLHVRSMVGLLPLCASTVIAPHVLDSVEKLRQRMGWVIRERSPLLETIARPDVPGEARSRPGAELSFRAEPRSGGGEESHSSRKRAR